MRREYRYAGPDGERIASLPAGAGAVIGSEYCVHLLPAGPELARAIAAAKAREIPLILLTPYFRDRELKKAVALVRAIPGGADVEVAVNDWGTLFMLRVLFPGLPVSIGRLLSGQKRCPRIPASTRLTPAGAAWHGQGLFSSPAGWKFLRDSYGVRGFHVDPVWQGGAAAVPPAGPADDEGRVPLLYVHLPYAAVTISDDCPWIGGRSSAAVSACSRPCRSGAVLLGEPSMGKEMVQRGKARFVLMEPPGMPESGERDCVRVVYEDLP